MHTGMPMYNQAAFTSYEDPTAQNSSNFVISYGAPNSGPMHQRDQRNQMPRGRNQEYMGRKNFNRSDNYGNNQRGPNNRMKPMQHRGPPRDNNFQKFPNRKFRQDEGSYDRSMERTYSDDRILPQSRKISKPMMNRQDRRPDDHRNMNYGHHHHHHHHSVNQNNYGYDRPMQRRPSVDSDNDPNRLNSSMFFKTKICPHHLEGICTRGPSCNYAHSENELRGTPNLKKTRLCQLFQIGKCNRGNMCSFAHGEQELRATPEFYKTSICNGYLKGTCRAGENCRYAHGRDELRANANEGEEFQNPVPEISQNFQQDPNGLNRIDYNNYYQASNTVNLDVSKDPKNNRFVINENNMHSYMNRPIPMDPNVIDPNYLNTNPTTNPNTNGHHLGQPPKNDNIAPNPYPINANFNSNVNNNWDRNTPNAKAPNPQTEQADNIAFHSFPPEKINSLFSSNETTNFSK